MNELNKAIDEAKKIIIAGHVRPDGDCIGACVALQRYIKRFYPEKNVCVYIETEIGREERYILKQCAAG